MANRFMDEQFLFPMAASLLAALVTTVGIAVVQRYEDWGRQNSSYFAAFAAGVLVYVGATHLLPAAEREPRRYSLLALAAGIATAIGVTLSH